MVSARFPSHSRIQPGRFAAMAQELRAEHARTADIVRRAQEETVETWSNKPDFVEEAASRGGDLITHIGPSDATGEIWWYLEDGTRIRYATMTPNFRAKTRPSRIRPGRGRGGVAFVNRRRPRPGIEARNWGEAIREREERPYTGRLRDIMRRAARR